MSIGVDVGGTKIAVGVLVGDELQEFHTQPTPESGWAAVLDAIAGQVRQLQVKYPQARTVGLGIPGPITPDRRRVKFAPNIYGFTDVPVVEGLYERLGQHVSLENDAKAAALAEAELGAARASSSSVYITVSTGIGSGIVLNGRLWRGQHGIAGELGHVVSVPGGPISGAGQSGTLEAVASGTAIARDASYALNREVSTAEAFALAQSGDRIAGRVVRGAMQRIGLAIADLQKMLDPEVFVLGGGVASVGAYFFEHVQAAADEAAEGFAVPVIRPAQLGSHAGVIGAALSAVLEPA
ncbi:ROK family protein [Deinococcus sp. KNUC1210]|uniref:ROK family protein n=1 Tax=Deinococcus sp. KNUC1210 TaxID=2917691 RepID=UPI001EF020F2|nr:ROK family protein [Deinococcus sp. KNUC1210]ULH16879.1 ROK family protein [Deinococcus sp. KNUC1210]